MSSTDLNYLLQHMKPEISAELLVIVSLDTASSVEHVRHAHAMIKESEGITLVLPQPYADQYNLPYQGIFAQITLMVESDLEAVGLTAAFASALASKQIPANVVAGFYHDHILIPQTMAQQALDTLIELSQQYAQ